MNLQPHYLINAQGERIAVQLSIKDYEELLEDIEDLTAIIERQNKPTIDFDVIIAELRADGLL